MWWTTEISFGANHPERIPYQSKIQSSENAWNATHTYCMLSLFSHRAITVQSHGCRWDQWGLLDTQQWLHWDHSYSVLAFSLSCFEFLDNICVSKTLSFFHTRASTIFSNIAAHRSSTGFRSGFWEVFCPSKDGWSSWVIILLKKSTPVVWKIFHWILHTKSSVHFWVYCMMPSVNTSSPTLLEETQSQPRYSTGCLEFLSWVTSWKHSTIGSIQVKIGLI